MSDILQHILVELKGLRTDMDILKQGQKQIQIAMGELQGDNREVREAHKAISNKLDIICKQITKTTELESRLRQRVGQAFLED